MSCTSTFKMSPNNALVFLTRKKVQPWEYDLHFWHEEVMVSCILGVFTKIIGPDVCVFLDVFQGTRPRPLSRSQPNKPPNLGRGVQVGEAFTDCVKPKGHMQPSL